MTTFTEHILHFLDQRELVNDLTYTSYATQRELSPEISPERWQKIYGPSACLMEKRFQSEQPCETCNSEREITQRGMDSDRAEVVDCPDCRKGKR